MLSVLLLLSACSGIRAGVPSETSAGASSADVNALLQEMIDTAPTLTYDDLIERLGPPLRTSAVSLEGPQHAVQPDTLRTVVYYGLELGFREHTASRTLQLAHFVLTDARYTSPEGLRVGYAESQVLRTLGLPTKRDPTRLIYRKEQPSHCVLTVFLEQRAVSRMEWRFSEE